MFSSHIRFKTVLTVGKSILKNATTIYTYNMYTSIDSLVSRHVEFELPVQYHMSSLTIYMYLQE